MTKRRFRGIVHIVCMLMMCGVVMLAAAQSMNTAATTSNGKPRLRSMTNKQRKAAAAAAAQRRAKTSRSQHLRGARTNANAPVGQPGGAPLTLDQLYFSGIFPNYANSPLPIPILDPNTGAVTGVAPGTGIRKFVDTLPGLNAPNDLGQMIPVAVPDTITFPGSDYYEISVREYSEQMHADLPPTKLRGYVQTNFGTDANGQNTVAPAGIQYLGPLIVAQTNRPVRIKFTNELPTGAGGDLFLPVDTTVMGSGLGLSNGASPYLQNRATIHLHGGNTPWISDGTPHQWTVPAGDFNNTLYPRGVSTQFVPDMYYLGGVVVPQCSANVTTNCSGGTPLNAQLPQGATNDPGAGSMTFYYTNEQSARLMFYHDHAYGTTRLNVYGGEAAGYLLQDSVESALVTGGQIPGTNVITPAATIPADQIPLIIQDKTFVPQNPASSGVYSVAVLAPGSGYTAPTVSFAGGGCTTLPTASATAGTAVDDFGQIIYGAVTGITLLTQGAGCTTIPDVTITDPTGTGAAAFASLATLSQQDPTWDITRWGGPGSLWYPHVYMTNQWPDNPDGSNTNAMGRWDYASWFWPQFNNGTYQVRGPVTCPTASNPLMQCPGFPNAINPAPAVDAAGAQHKGVGSTESLTPEAFMDTPIVNGTAYPKLTVDPKPYRLRILNAANDRSFNLSLFVACGSAGYTPGPGVNCPSMGGTEVPMVPAAPTSGFPAWWPTDGRDGGVPDPAAMGPSWVAIGSEGGFLPKPVVIPPAPVGYEYNRRSVTVLNVSSHSLLLMGAERADVIVDFSQYAGKTLILYNDAPAPMPAFDTRYDYYTGDPDQTGFGGAPTTLPGYGPNTRTIMQITVNAGTPAPFNPAALNTALPAAFRASQPVPVVPEPAFSAAYGGNYPGKYAQLQDNNITYTPIGGNAPITLNFGMKTIQELFELDYGRMDATLGTELPFTNFNNQTTIPLGYVDPFTENIYDSALVSAQPVGVAGDGTQIWKVTHNGVDSHAIHFHLFNVQLLNRVGWDGTIRPPEPLETGWKDTVRMNPLEIDYVALRPMSQTTPFPVPDSIRLLDVTMPVGPDPALSAVGPTGNAVPQNNVIAPLGWEYVWHCHILGHEENDMMRDITFQVPPQAPSNLVATAGQAGVVLTFTDNALSETGFTLERADDINFTLSVVDFALPSQASYGTIASFTDATAVANTQYYYRVRSFKPDSSFYGQPLPNLVSAWSNVVQIIAAPVAGVAPTSLAFGNQLLNSTSAPQSVTLSNAGSAVLNINNIQITGVNAADFAQTTTCGATLTPGTNCTITVSFTPIAVGARTAGLVVSSNDSVNPTLTVALTGTGMTPVAGITPISLAFGNQPLNTTSAAQTITLSNTGNMALTLNSITVTGANATNFAQTNNCGASLAAAASCTISVTFTPTVTGALSAAITISSNDPVNPTLNAALTGTGTAPVVGVSPTSLAFGNQLVNTNSAAQTLTLSNTGNQTLTINSIALTGANTAEFGMSNLCGATLAAGGNCTIDVTFKPTSMGAKAASVVINSADPVNPTLTISIAGTGIAPVAGVSPASLAFGNQFLNTASALQAITLTNTGTAPLLLNSIGVTGANAADFAQSNTCGTSVAAGGNCTINVVFTPSAVGARSASVTISSSDPVNPTIAVSATGTGVVPVASVSPASLAFGNQLLRTTSAPQSVTLSNTGTAPLAIAGVGLTGANASEFAISASTCGAVLANGSNCTISITFTPLTFGAKAASLVITSNDPANPTLSVSLSGTGAGLSLSSNALSFGAQVVNTTSAAQTVTVLNTSTSNVTFTSVSVTGANAGDFIMTTGCTGVLRPGRTCNVNVRFRPTAVGARVATVVLTDSDPTSPQTIALSGTGTTPIAQVSPASVTFGNQPIRTTSPAQTVTLSNTGSAPLTITRINIGGGNANQFAQSNTCPPALAAGASCNISVTFTPTTRGNKNSNLNVTVAAPAASQTVPLTGTGQ